jgi:hypothetical protein
MNSTDKIRALNDALRNLTGEGHIYVTAGIAALSDEEQAVILTRVFTYSDFTPESDPHARRPPAVLRRSCTARRQGCVQGLSETTA